MGNSRVSGPFISGGEIYAAGTTQYKAKPGSAGTVRAKSGTITAYSGFRFANGNDKQFAAGTFVGSGAATQAIVASGLTTIHHVFFNRVWQSRNAGATTRAAYSPSPAKAQGTPGSFYPLIGFIAPGAVAAHTLGIGAGATFSWFCIGAKNI